MLLKYLKEPSYKIACDLNVSIDIGSDNNSQLLLSFGKRKRIESSGLCQNNHRFDFYKM